MRIRFILILLAVASAGCKPSASRVTAGPAKQPPAGEALSDYAVILSPGPAWDYSRTRDEQIGIMEHRNFMASLYDRGLMEGGPFEDALGGLAILRARSLTEARAIAERDPGFQRGLLKIEVHQWRVRWRDAPAPPSRS
jgi:uncharacterized protein YciI